MKLYPLDKLNLVLTLSLATLLGLIYKPDVAVEPLLAVDAGSVNELRITENGQLRLSLLRDQEGWLLTHPQIQRANPKRVQQLLGLLEAPSLMATQTARDAAGLEPPALIFSADDRQLSVGGPSTPPGHRYVALDGSVHLVDDNWYRILNLPASFYLTD